MSDFWQAFTREQADRQYNPTLWSQRLAADELLPTHIELTTAKSQRYREQAGIRWQTMGFGEGEYAGEIDVFEPTESASDAPLVVYIHGGWWQWFSKEQFSFIAEPFNRLGYPVYLPGYRLAQDWQNNTPMESILTQMEQATVAILKAAEAKDSQAVYLVGHSAGGHLVTLLRETDWRQFGLEKVASKKLKGVFSIAGLFDLRPLLNSFVNDEIKMSEQSARALSPFLLEANSEKSNCPIHLLLPEHDTPEFFRQTKEYQAKLLQAGQACEIYLANNRDHLDIIENLVLPDDKVLKYIVSKFV